MPDRLSLLFGYFFSPRAGPCQFKPSKWHKKIVQHDTRLCKKFAEFPQMQIKVSKYKTKLEWGNWHQNPWSTASRGRECTNFHQN
jgi:hypothetical protein